MLSPSRSPSRSFSLTLSMESPEAASSGFPPLPPEPPNPDLDVMLQFDPHVLPVPPDPPPILIDTADFNLTSLHYSSLQVFEDWILKVEILAVVSLRYAASLTSVQPIGVNLFTALSSSQSKANRHLKPWSHMVGPISPCFMLSQVFNGLSRRYLSLGKQKIMLFVYLAMVVCLTATNLLEEGLVASELVDVPFPVGYVENFPTCSANGTWIVVSTQSAKAVLLQKTSHSTLSSGLSSLQIQADIVPFFALRSGLVLIEITGFYFVRNLVPLVIPLSCSYILCKTFCLVVVVLVMGEVPKLCSSSTLF
ncbi:hypothetical protein Bca4012_057442 [Brassica carinata]